MVSIPNFSIAFRSPGYQCLIGMLFNFLYLLVLISYNTSYQNIQLPEGIYSENLWKGTDVLTYVKPARNFVQHGIFGYGSIPDYKRTIGYQFFLSLFMIIFDTNWLIPTLLAQAVLFSLMYPLLSKIAVILFNSDNYVVAGSFLFFILSGIYIIRTPMILTDTFFTVLLTLGLWSGLEAVRKKSYKYLLLHVISIGYAAQVRPLLLLYPIINCFVLIYVSKKYKTSGDIKVYLSIMSSFFLLLIICSIPSIRNYRNHGFFKQSSILSANFFNDLGRHVMIGIGENDKFNEMRRSIQKITDIKEQMQLQEELAMKIYVTYPLTTLKEFIHNAIGIMGRAHWPVAANFWGYNFEDNFDAKHMQMKKLAMIFYLELFFNLVYFIVYLLFLGFLIRNFRSGDFALVLVICLFIGYLLIPTFIIRGSGSRLRLPVEGLIIIMASCEFEKRFDVFKGKLLRLINR
jgi:hypothetical protein